MLRKHPNVVCDTAFADEEAGTAEALKERRRRHPRRKYSLREFIESMEDSKPK